MSSDCYRLLLVDFTLLVGACGALLDLWFRSSLCAPARAYLESRRELPGGWWAQLLTCPLCLSFHVVYLVGLLLFVARLHVEAGLAIRLVLGWLAAAFAVYRLRGGDAV